jgi:hypothetical protein
MRIQSSWPASGVVLVTLLLTVSTSASDHHTLNGTWTLVPAKSDFAGQDVVQTGTVTIDDRQGNITVARNFTYNGANQTFSYSFSTDGQENSTIKDGKDFKSKAKWERNVLRVTTTHGGVTTVERFSLAADGTLILNVDQPDHRPIALVFQRK